MKHDETDPSLSLPVEPLAPTAGGAYDYQPTDSAAGFSQSLAALVEVPPVEVAPEQPPAPASAGMKRAVLGNAAWTMIGFGVMQILRFAFNIIQARLVAPEVFGTLSLVYSFITALHMFTDVGVNPSIIQSKRGDDPDFLNTAWSIQVVRGFVLWFCSLLIAWPVAVFYETPILMFILPVIGMNEAISGMDSTALSTLRRRMERPKLVILELATYVISMSITLTWLWFYPTVWALVVGSNISALFQMVCSHLIIRGYRTHLRWDKTAVQELMHFGKWIIVSTMLTFFAAQSDRLIVGKVSVELLGIYQIAANLAAMPATLMVTMGWQLVFPLYSRMHQSGADIRRLFARIHPVAAGFGGFFISGIIASGPTLVTCLYKEVYHAAGPILQILALGVWFQVLEATGGSILFALGRPRASALSNAAKVVTLLLLAPYAYLQAEEKGSILQLVPVFVIADFVRYLFTALAVRREGAAVLRYDFLLTAIVAVTSLAALMVGQLPYLEEMKWLRFFAEALTVTFLWSILALIAWARGMFQMKNLA